MAISNNNKTIAKNTAFLYIRMVVIMIISLFSSRLLLHELGVDDFGTYGVVGGIVSMFASLKTMFTVATQRFLNIEIGHGDDRELSKVFNISILVNVTIIVVFLVLVEVVGLWLLETKLQIAADRMQAARWVFHLSVLASAITIFNIPFDADIIARERMNIFAYVSIFDAVAKLGIILLLPILGGDKLVIYGLLMMGVSLCNLVINWYYCRTHFPESQVRRYPIDETTKKFKEMFAFSGWAFFGNIAYALTNEGINVLLNIFGGTLANASRTIAYQIRAAVSSLTSNVFTAVKPQAIQSYAQNDMERYYKLSFTGGKVVGYMFLLLAVPIYFGLDELLEIWLKDVPVKTHDFVTALFIYMFIRTLHESIGTFFVTIGKIKGYQITECFLLSTSLLFAYVGFKWFNMPLYGAFLCMAFSELINMVAILLLAQKIGDFNIRLFLSDVLLPYIVMGIVCFGACYLLRILMNPLLAINKWFVFIFIATAAVILLGLMFTLGLHKDERTLIKNIIKRK